MKNSKEQKEKQGQLKMNKINGEQGQLDEIANQEFKWGEERRYDQAQQYVYDEDGIVPLDK